MLGRTADFSRRLLGWYARSKRDLPWRLPQADGRPHPYHVLVSELMLQQTQVATVIPYFIRFLDSFPTIADLARASEHDVLRHWQGLGYYSRARNLLRAAQMVIAAHGGAVPADLVSLLTLPGIGRYTAGAVSSIAFGVRSPILDGNVTRVLCRLDKITADPRERQIVALLWRRAEEILPRRNAGDFNSALMELGATVCIPRNPRCLICPVRVHCEARAAGVQEEIPPPKKRQPIPLERRIVVCIERDGEWLIEQRPPSGRWAGMWQFLTRTAGTDVQLPVATTPPCALGEVGHQLTHRQYEFDVRWCRAKGRSPAALDGPHAWVALSEIGDYPLPRPHLKIAQMLAELPQK